jgi:hypothetical protein
MTFRVAHWETLDDNLAFIMEGEDIMSILKASVTCLHFSMQEEDILEHINGKCHFMYTSVNL